ncbi:hypothetical protein R1flu_008148 [Riccia fluitans]|uniref:RanBD1 domain-containing protein n=1 Tax=Riccia fluitans TaxID=41844 RepID=A0ABD1YAW2_9MARC
MASNEEPPSKKRVAVRQISKDDDQDSADEDEHMQAATFRRASDEVLAERRIVKVRRTPVPAFVPNPFASVKLVLPSASTQATQESIPASFTRPTGKGTAVKPNLLDAEGMVSAQNGGGREKSDQVSSPTVHVAREKPTEVLAEIQPSIPDAAADESGFVPVSSITAESEAAGGENVTNSGTGEATEEGKKTETAEEVPKAGTVEEKEDNDLDKSSERKAKGSEGESVVPGSVSLGTFQLLSGTKNAFASSFGTGFSSTPFVFSTTPSTTPQPSAGLASFGASFTSSSQPFRSSFSFGQSPFGANSSSAGTFPLLSSVFRQSNGPGSPSFGFAAPTSSAPVTVAPIPTVVPLQEVQMETGEEKEKAAFTADAALFEFIEGGWKERGRGELKLNVSEEKGKKARLVMRSKGNYRLLLNARLFADMKVTKMDNRGISFVCVNSAAEGKNGLATYAIKFKDGVIAAEFSRTVQTHKGNAVSSDLTTPESSPKSRERPSEAADTSEVG